MIALIAGQGSLPTLLFAHLQSEGREPLVVELDGFPSELLVDDKVRFRIEHLGTVLGDLKKRGVTELCFAGRVGRPNLDAGMVDAATEPFVPGILHAIQSGDDSALREILAIFEEFGFSLLSVQDIMPQLLPPAGVLTVRKPEAHHEKDVLRASQILQVLGQVDVGQGCVVAAGQVLAVETAGGTDWMLNSLSQGNRPRGPSGGVLVKAPKPGQDLRADVPTVGPKTITGLMKAGLDGLVVEQGGVLMLQPDEMQKMADDLGLFIWIREPQ